MRKRSLSFILSMALLLTMAPPVSAANKDTMEPVLKEYKTEIVHDLYSNGRYVNWAGVSSVSQFKDENGRFCFAVDEGDTVRICKTDYGKVTSSISIKKPYSLFGGAVCGSDGSLFLIWGNENNTEDYSVNTILVSKYTANGKLISAAGGNGSEGMPYYYGERFYTKTPFHAGNCDAAINGNLLCVNYARRMYGGHQANTVFVVNTDTMEVQTGITTYNSHSFDQRVTPYSKTGGFLLESHGDCFDRAFTTEVTDAESSLHEMNTFDFWVEEDTYSKYDMGLLNRTRARLGNILETKYGAMLIAASARSLSAKADNEPYDVFVQVFDPEGSVSDPATYVTAGERSGLAGNNGNEQVTNYGVRWLTDFAKSGEDTDVVQAVSVNDDEAVVLFELENSSRYMLLDGKGSILRKATDLGSVSLNTDEDPVYAQGAVQWVSSNKDGKLVIHSLCLDREDAQFWCKDDYDKAAAVESLIASIGTVTLDSGKAIQNARAAYDALTAFQRGLLSDYAEYALTSAEAAYKEKLAEKARADKAAADAVAAMIDSIGTVTLDSGDAIEAARNAYKSLTADQKKLLPDAEKQKLSAAERSYIMLLYPDNPFKDVDESSYFYDSVLWAVNQDPKITTGTSAVTFSPNASCTRGEAVTFLWRACGCEKVEGENPFTDVNPGDYYYDAVLWALKHNITNGMSAEIFGPGEKCTRAQIVTFLWRARGKPAAADSVAFTDVAKKAYYYDSVKWAVANEITNGTSTKTFSPDDLCTRGQIVTFLYRAMR